MKALWWIREAWDAWFAAIERADQKAHARNITRAERAIHWLAWGLLAAPIIGLLLWLLPFADR
jgi:hypothetical protein